MATGVATGNPVLNQVLESFITDAMSLFQDRLLSAMLYGSVVLNDLAPGYGDLDFLIVVEGDLSPEDCWQLVALRAPLRQGSEGLLGQMLEGAFLPRAMLDPARSGSAFWWGTRGERPWTHNQLGALVLHTICRTGVVIYGSDLRGEIPLPSRQDLLLDVRQLCRTMQEHGRGGTLHSIDWLLTAARELLWLQEGRLSSKSEAALWAYEHATGEWREDLPRARHLRLNPSLADEASWAKWLDELTGSIQQARVELERELARQGATSRD